MVLVVDIRSVLNSEVLPQSLRQIYSSYITVTFFSTSLTILSLGEWGNEIKE